MTSSCFRAIPIAVAGILCILSSQIPVSGDVLDAGQKGSLLVFPIIELKWDLSGNLIKDTFITLTNDYPGVVYVQLYMVNGDPPLPASPPEREHLGHNWAPVTIRLEPDQSIYWSLASGYPAGVIPFTALDPNDYPDQPGRPAMDGTSTRTMRGFMYAWAVDTNGNQINWNHLSGKATITELLHGSIWQYGAYASQVPYDSGIPHGSTLNTPEELNLDGQEYQTCPSYLTMDLFAVGSAALSDSSGMPVTCDTELALLPVKTDFRLYGTGPVTTKAKFSVWNMNEMKFSNTERCIELWDSQLLSLYNAPNHFLLTNLHTDKGQARIEGVSSIVCGETSQDAPLLAVAKNLLDFDSGSDFGGSAITLSGSGEDDSGTILVDVDSLPPAVLAGDPHALERPLATSSATYELTLPPTDGQRWTAQPRSALTKPGSLLVFPNIELRWNYDGSLTQDTFIELTNLWIGSVSIHLEFVNGDPQLPETPTARAHSGWNNMSSTISLTPNQPMYWAASTGEPAFVLPFADLDPGYPLGRPATDGSSDRVMRGYLYVWAVNGDDEEISWNSLIGKATIVNYQDGDSWTYAPIAFPVDTDLVDRGEPSGTPGALNMDGTEYASCPSMLLMDFFAAGSCALTGNSRIITADTAPTLLIADQDFRQGYHEPPSTSAQYDVWNANGTKFSDAQRCITLWNQQLLSSYDPVNYFLISNLGTDNGKARIDGVSNPNCDGETNPTPLLGVSNIIAYYDVGIDIGYAGTTLVGMGTEGATVQLDVDCNDNDIPDSWEISQGSASDCNANGVPDQCDIDSGTSSDANSNLIPDECELKGDYDSDMDVDIDDYLIFNDCFNGPESTPSPTPPTSAQECLFVFDFDEDGDVDFLDASDFTKAFAN